MDLTAHATRSGAWWAVEVPAIAGLHTQAKRLDQVPAMVADAAAALTGDPASSFSVEVVPHLPHVDARAVAKEVSVARGAYEAAAQALTATNQIAVTVLKEVALSVRDIGWILSLSPQRVSAIDAARSDTSTGSHLEIRQRMGFADEAQTHTRAV